MIHMYVQNDNGYHNYRALKIQKKTNNQTSAKCAHKYKPIEY